MMLPIQLSSVLRVLPSWLPTVTIAIGFVLLSIGTLRQYLDGLFPHADRRASPFLLVSTVCLSTGTAGATYLTIRRHELTVLFVFFVFFSGRIVQGAVAARQIQVVIEFLLAGTRSGGPTVVRDLYRRVVDKLKRRLLLLLVTGIITCYTLVSVAAVYVVGAGDPTAVIERLWIGFFFLMIAGLVFDFRYFAPRISWTAAVGLIIAIAGAFLYSPVGFSPILGSLSPYLTSPVPDWMRSPLGLVGFLVGVFLWAGFFVTER